MALTQISTQGIKDGTITGTDLATNVDLVDNQKLRLGTGNDLQIYHDGSNSYLINTTGELNIRDESRIKLRTDQFVLNNHANDENIIYAAANGAVELYHNGSKKFETTSTGATVTGTISAGGAILSGNQSIASDSAKLFFGASNDLEIYHNGSHSYIDDAGTGNLYIRSSQLVLQNAAGDEDLAILTSNGAVELYYDNVKKFQTTNGGINITGSVACSGGASNNLSLPDNGKAKFGDGDDLQIYHLSSGGGDSYITNSNGNLNIVNSTDGWIRLQPKSGEEGVIVKYDGAVELYHDNSKKLQTESWGVDITGTLRADTLKLSDDHKLQFGIGNDLEIYHDGSDSYIKDAGTGQLLIFTNQFRLQNAAGNEQQIAANEDGAVDLFYDGSKKFETTSTGINIPASVPTITLSDTDGNTPYSRITAGGGDLVFEADQGDEEANTLMLFRVDDSEKMRIDSSGNVGIGKTPSDRLDVQTTHASGGRIATFYNSDSGNNGGLIIQGGGSDGEARLQSAGGSSFLTFYTEGSSLAERMRINSSGNVGIGTSSPSHLFHVNGTSRTTALLVNSSGGHNSSRVHIVGHSTGSHTNIRCADSAGNQLLLLRNDGPFFVQGVYDQTTSGSVNVRVLSDGQLKRSTSSVRYKKDITDATWGLSEVLKLKPKTFKNNVAGEDADEKTYGGFTAEDVHDLGLTEFVDYNEKNEPDALAYGNMVALMAKAIQDLNAKIETLETEVAALKAS